MVLFIVGAFHPYSQNLHLVLGNTNVGKEVNNVDTIVHSYTAAMRSYHCYKQFWNPAENEERRCNHEEYNLYDKYAIKVIHENGKIVGHLPRELC